MGATTGLTATGQVIGTVDYMAPEQIEAQRVDARTDVYALGGVLYHALTGKVPYAERESSAKMWAHVNEQPPSAGSAGSVLDPVIRRAMAKDPADRFPSAGDLGRAAVAATRGEAVTEPEHVVGAGEAAPLPETVRLSRDPALPPTDPMPRPGRGRRRVGFALALVAIAAFAVVGAIEAPKLSRSTGTATAQRSLRVAGRRDRPLAGGPATGRRRAAPRRPRAAPERARAAGSSGSWSPPTGTSARRSPGAGSEVSPGSTVELTIDRPDVC